MEYANIIDIVNKFDFYRKICRKCFVNKYVYDGYFNCTIFFKQSWTPHTYSINDFYKDLEKNKTYNDDFTYEKQVRDLLSNVLNLTNQNNRKNCNDIIIEFIREYVYKYVKSNNLIRDKAEPYRFDSYIIRHDLVPNYIDDLPGYIAQIVACKNKNEQLFFRGHSNINYILLPYIQRKEKWFETESQFYYDIQRVCPSYFNSLSTHINRLVEMQHYEVPTRLLDITMNALVALFFSAYSPNNADRNKNGEVIIFSADKSKVKYGSSDTITILSCLPAFSYGDQIKIANQVEYYKSNPIDSAKTKFNDDETIQRLLQEIRSEKPAFRPVINPDDLCKNILVMPALLNNRIIKQSGAFIVTGLVKNREDVLANNINELRYKSRFNKTPILIIRNKDAILKQLNLCGINEATMFPEIDKVAEYLKNV